MHLMRTNQRTALCSVLIISARPLAVSPARRVNAVVHAGRQEGSEQASKVSEEMNPSSPHFHTSLRKKAVEILLVVAIVVVVEHHSCLTPPSTSSASSTCSAISRDSTIVSCIRTTSKHIDIPFHKCSRRLRPIFTVRTLDCRLSSTYVDLAAVEICEAAQTLSNRSDRCGLLSAMAAIADEKSYARDGAGVLVVGHQLTLLLLMLCLFYRSPQPRRCSHDLRLLLLPPPPLRNAAL